MKFNRHQAIYLQIGDHICDGILEDRWAVDQKLPSVREMAMAVEVNPNTVMRTYSELQNQAIIYNRRGIGFFVSPEARQQIMAIKKEVFLTEELPRIFKTLGLLDISFEELQRLYREHRDKEVNP
jgi:DNA-binding transcriptional regulator YhcF (GntR family)